MIPMIQVRFPKAMARPRVRTTYVFLIEIKKPPPQRRLRLRISDWGLRISIAYFDLESLSALNPKPAIRKSAIALCRRWFLFGLDELRQGRLLSVHFLLDLFLSLLCNLALGRDAFTPHDHFDFLGIQGFKLHKRFRQAHQFFAVLIKNYLRLIVALHDKTPYFLVDLKRRFFAVILVLGDFTAQKDLLFFLSESKRAHHFTHSPFTDHGSRAVGDSLQIVG